MSLDWAPFVDLVRQHQRFVLTCHVRPDGDALGSMLGLADALTHLGKSVRMTVASVIPPRYDFMYAPGSIVRFSSPGNEYRDADAIIVLDTGTWNQLGDFATLLRELKCSRAVLDHHLTQDDLGALRMVDTSAEATGRLVHEAITALATPLTPDAAHALFIALAMDTGWFRHLNTTPRTMTLAAQLIESGARPTEAYEMLFEQNTPGRLRLTGLVLSRVTVSADGRICQTEIRKGDYESTGAVPQDSEDLVNYTRSVAGVEVGLFFMEQPKGGIKVSLRSRERVDVARIAEQFGGGGHKLAAGCVLDTDLEDARQRIVAVVVAALDS